ncbi:MAG: Phosphocholine transferase AnkX [Candidatus Anoxychlamydiales bacterium]|nr:Phosphocholine transferase AnkX [Candidatus Anoxychlamydiales bacterium]
MKASGVSSSPDRPLGSSDGFECIKQKKISRIPNIALSIISAIPLESKAQTPSLQSYASAALEEEKSTSSAVKPLEFKSDRDAQTALFNAIAKDDCQKVREILSNEDLKNHILNEAYGVKPPLGYAAALGHGDIVDLLIELGADVNKYLHRFSLYHLSQFPDITQKLIAAGADINAQDIDKETLLFKASKGKLIDLVNFLLENGADFTIPNKDGFTPVMIAIENGNIEIARLLIEKGADIYQKISGEMTCLDKAFVKKNKLAVKTFFILAADFNIRRPFSLFRDTIRHGLDDELLEYIIKKISNINEKDSLGNTALHLATHSSAKIIELLISAGVEVNNINLEHETPLHFAARLPTLKVVELLIDAGADINAKNSAGQTPLDIAIRKGQFEIAIALKEAGAICNIDAKNPDGYTLLQLAIEKGNLEEAKALIEFGTNVKAKTTTINNFGLTPLMLSIIYDRDDITSFLLEQENIDVEATDPNGVTTLMYAASRNKLDTVRALVEKGADVNAQDNIGLTAEDYVEINNGVDSTFETEKTTYVKNPIDSVLFVHLCSLASGKNEPIEYKDKSKPNALVILPKDDPNKEFSIERKLHYYASLMKGYNVQTRYISSTEELNKLLKERTYKNLSILGHGTVAGDGIILSKEFTLTKENIKEINFDNLDQRAKIFSVACNVGREDGLADKIAKISKKEVTAAKDKVSFFSTKVTTKENGETDLEFYETPVSDKNLTRKIKYYY